MLLIGASAESTLQLSILAGVKKNKSRSNDNWIRPHPRQLFIRSSSTVLGTTGTIFCSSSLQSKTKDYFPHATVCMFSQNLLTCAATANYLTRASARPSLKLSLSPTLASSLSLSASSFAAWLTNSFPTTHFVLLILLRVVHNFLWPPIAISRPLKNPNLAQWPMPLGILSYLLIFIFKLPKFVAPERYLCQRSSANA